MSPSNTPNGRFDLLSQASSMMERDQRLNSPMYVGSMRSTMWNAVKAALGLDFTEKKPPKEKVAVAKKPEAEDPKKEKKKDDPAGKTAA